MSCFLDTSAPFYAVLDQDDFTVLTALGETGGTTAPQALARH